MCLVLDWHWANGRRSRTRYFVITIDWAMHWKELKYAVLVSDRLMRIT